MTRPYRLSPREPLASDHPLHWLRFWPDIQRQHRSKIEARQDLILWLASLHHSATKGGKPRGFSTVQMRLMDLRSMVRDYRPALEYFFDVQQLGYYLDIDHHEISTLVPKELSSDEDVKIEKVVRELLYVPPERDDTDTVVSKVYVRTGLDERSLIDRCANLGRPELVPALKWVLRQPSEMNFLFTRSGKLKLRDTSVWPIPAIETWPSWLREELFGPGIDLDSSYVQFLLHYLREAFATRPQLVNMLFPDLIRLLEDKEAYRKELCEEVLQRPYDARWKTVIKRVIMSLANGSRISPALLMSGSGFSLTAEIIIDAAPEAGLMDLERIGAHLKRISDQFSAARKHVCLHRLKKMPTRKNVKDVFSDYFLWERAARYAIWEEVGRHGIMVHDGLDGVPQEHLDRLPEIMAALNLRLTA